MRRKFKRLAALLVSAVMVLPFFTEYPSGTFDLDWWASAEGETDDGVPNLNDNGTANDTSDDYYEIGTADELYWFAEYVNSGNDSANAKLTADITVNESLDGSPREWFPIGYYCDRDGDGDDEDVYFNGTFDGQNHTISGLYFDNPSMDYVGFIGQISENAYIKNVGITDSFIRGNFYVGGVCGHNVGGTITNCHNKVTVNGVNYVGGVCGYNYSGTIENCYNTATVSGAYFVGGVCGENYGTITNCYNTGSVSGTGDSVGGVCGYNDSNGTIENCYYLSGTATGGINGANVAGSAEEKTEEQFASGEIAYLLQGGQTADEKTGEIPHVWGQNITDEPKDTYPVLVVQRFMAEVMSAEQVIQTRLMKMLKTASVQYAADTNRLSLKTAHIRLKMQVSFTGLWSM